MSDTSGFYKLDDDILLYGTLVCGPTYTLIEGETYTYPVDGWYWFDTEAEAREFFNLPPAPEPEAPAE
jgi:hypothetical protein